MSYVGLDQATCNPHHETSDRKDGATCSDTNPTTVRVTRDAVTGHADSSCKVRTSV